MVRIDTLVNIITYCIALLAFGTVALHVNIYVAVIFTVVFLLSIYLYFMNPIKIPDVILTAVSVGIITISALRVQPDDFVMPSLEALTLLLGVKLLATRRFRDFMQIYAMALLLLAGSTLIDIRIIFLIYFMAMMLLLNAAIVVLAYYSESQYLHVDYGTAAAIIHKTAYIAIIAIPLTAFFFFILPRSTYPLLTFLNIGKSSHSGFTDEVQLGDVTEIQANSEVVFRAQMGKVRDEDLYWRGVVLDFFDGKGWRSTEKASETSTYKIGGPTVAQTIYLEPTDNTFLFALDRPVKVLREHTYRTHNLSYRSKTEITGKTRYTAHSIPSRVYPAELLHWDKYLQLPENLSGPVADLVGRLIADKNPADQPLLLSNYFRKADYHYALQNLPLSDNPIEDFLITYRYGNCEYFASALAVMLRIAGIPSRVVGGYRGGTYNDLGQYYVVTQNEAHLWTEAYVAGSGWLRLDPTPPLRVMPNYYKLQEFFKKVSLALDTINYYWNMVVVNYSFKDQLKIMSKLSEHAREFRLRIDRTRLLAFSFLPLLLALMVYLLKTRMSGRTPVAMKLVNEFNDIMNRHGYPRASHEGLEEFLARVADTGLHDKAGRFVVAFEELYYRDLPLTKPEVKTLQAYLKDLRETV
jgi:protein-glutamine gamma-glutamyltransferase